MWWNWNMSERIDGIPHNAHATYLAVLICIPIQSLKNLCNDNVFHHNVQWRTNCLNGENDKCGFGLFLQVRNQIRFGSFRPARDLKSIAQISQLMISLAYTIAINQHLQQLLLVPLLHAQHLLWTSPSVQCDYTDHCIICILSLVQRRQQEERLQFNLQFSSPSRHCSFHLDIFHWLASSFSWPLRDLLSSVFSRHPVCFATGHPSCIGHTNVFRNGSNVGQFGNSIAKHACETLWLWHRNSWSQRRKKKKKRGGKKSQS